ncbi:UTP18, partial [Symbiodinium sp. KB8]
METPSASTAAWERRKKTADERLEKGLEVSVFGDDSVVTKLGKELQPKQQPKRRRSEVLSDEGSDLEEKEEAAAAAGSDDDVAWHDSDDEEIAVDLAEATRLRKLRTSTQETVVSGKEYEKRLRRRVEEKNPSVAWAVEDEEGTEEVQRRKELALTEEESAVLRQTGSLTSSSALLPRGSLDIVRVKDANYKSPAKAVVTAVDFHPSGQLLMTASMDKKVKLFQ